SVTTRSPLGNTVHANSVITSSAHHLLGRTRQSGRTARARPLRGDVADYRLLLLPAGASFLLSSWVRSVSRLILPRWSMSAISARILSPTLTTSSTLSIRLPLPSFEMCSRPSLPGSSETKAPNAAVLTTVPRYRSPTLGSCGRSEEHTSEL